MKLQDSLLQAPSGVLALQVYRRGVLIDSFVDRNLIVDNSKQIHARLLGGSFTNRNITQFGVGTSGAAPAGGNTALTGAFLKPIGTISYPLSNQVQFAFSLTTAEANGMAILEFGLLTADNTLYARKTRTLALNKAADISLSGTWTISF